MVNQKVKVTPPLPDQSELDQEREEMNMNEDDIDEPSVNHSYRNMRQSLTQGNIPASSAQKVDTTDSQQPISPVERPTITTQQEYSLFSDQKLKFGFGKKLKVIDFSIFMKVTKLSTRNMKQSDPVRNNVFTDVAIIQSDKGTGVDFIKPSLFDSEDNEHKLLNIVYHQGTYFAYTPGIQSKNKMNIIDTNIWYICRFMPNKQVTVTQGDVLRFGRIPFKIKTLKIEGQNLQESFSRLPNNSVDISAADIDESSIADYSRSAITTLNMTDNDMSNMDKPMNVTGMVQRVDQNINKGGLSNNAAVVGKVTESGKACRICLEDEEEEGNPFITPCKCTGSVKFIHLTCIQSWLDSKRISQKLNGVYSYYWDDLACELCKEPLQLTALKIAEGKIIDLLNYKQPKSGSYMVLESDIECVSKAIHVVDLSKKQTINVGRRVNNDITVSDISVSRRQSTIKVNLETRHITVEDCDSKFGTFVKILQPVTVEPGFRLPIQIEKKVFFLKSIERFSCWSQCLISMNIVNRREMYDHYQDVYEKFPNDLKRFFNFVPPSRKKKESVLVAVKSNPTIIGRKGNQRILDESMISNITDNNRTRQRFDNLTQHDPQVFDHPSIDRSIKTQDKVFDNKKTSTYTAQTNLHANDAEVFQSQKKSTPFSQVLRKLENDPREEVKDEAANNDYQDNTLFKGVSNTNSQAAINHQPYFGGQQEAPNDESRMSSRHFLHGSIVEDSNISIESARNNEIMNNQFHNRDSSASQLEQVSEPNPYDEDPFSVTVSQKKEKKFNQIVRLSGQFVIGQKQESNEEQKHQIVDVFSEPVISEGDYRLQKGDLNAEHTIFSNGTFNKPLDMQRFNDAKKQALKEYEDNPIEDRTAELGELRQDSFRHVDSKCESLQEIDEDEDEQ